MKKLLCIALAACWMNVNAQISIGGKAGLNLSNLNGGSLDQVKKSMKVGYYLGGYVDFWLGNNFAIQPEALFSVQGTKLDSASINLSYINIPILAKYKTDGGFYVEAGPQFGFNVAASNGDKSFKDEINGSDLSACFGAGFQSSGKFGIGARYVLGLTKVGDAAHFTDPNFKNSNIQIGLFIGIGGPSSKKK